MIDYPAKDRYTADDLVAIVALLRDPENGCPWDKAQTHASIRMNFLEEAYEAVDAIDLNDPALLREELGDVLMQVAFHAVIESESGRFGWGDICDEVCRKLIGRHPHIFGPAEAAGGINDWDSIKNKEKGRLTLADDLASVPRAMPALMRAAKLQKRAQRHGVAPPAADARTLGEAAAALAAAPPQSEEAGRALGALLTRAVALARQKGLDPEQITKGKTLISIAHRLSTVKNADQIVVISDGKVAQKGTHAELISQDGIYSRFWKQRELASGWKLK